MPDITEEQYRTAVLEYLECKRRIDQNEVWEDEIKPYIAELCELYIKPYLAEHGE